MLAAPLVAVGDEQTATLTVRGEAALQRDAEFGRQFLIEFQDRLLFGRDYFDARLMDFIKEQNLPAEAFDKIAYQNAQRLLDQYL